MAIANDKARRIVIVGGGIAGLAAAYRLGQARSQGALIDERLIEATDRLGGVIRTDRLEGCVVEAGPDSFLGEKPEAATLAREVGLGGALMGSNDGGRRTYVFRKGRLEALPDGLMLMIPTRLWPVCATPLIPFSSKLAVVKEWLRGRAPGGPSPGGDESAASFIARHFGRGMLTHIAEPLLAGVYGGNPDNLSAQSVLARFREMEQKHGSLIRGALALRKQRSEAHRGPIFMTLRDGLGSLVDALAGCIESGGVELRRRVVSLERRAADDRVRRRYRIFYDDGSSLDSDAVILALPAWAAAAVLADFDGTLANQLAGIEYQPALTVALAYGREVRARLPPGFGFLVPRTENRRLVACTFVHAKFNHRAPPDQALLRCFLGGERDPGIVEASDEEVLRIVRKELRSILGINAEPLFSRIYRWPRAMAQYNVGHAERLRAVKERLRGHPGLCVAGNAYEGIGIPDCVRSGERAAREALAILAPRVDEVLQEPRAS